MFWEVSEVSVPCRCRICEGSKQLDVSSQILLISVPASCSTRALVSGNPLETKVLG
jgi:hypothetical protein